MKFLSVILAKAGLIVDGVVTLNNTANATTNTDKFVVIDSGVVKYRTAAQLLSDTGSAADNAVVHIAGTETVTGQKTFSGGVMFTQSFGNIHIRSVTGLGNLSFSQYTVAGAASIDFRAAFVGANYQTAGTANCASVGVVFGAGNLPAATSGTHPLMASVAIKAFNIGLNAGSSTTNAATLYIEAAPTQATSGNYALWVDDGLVRLDGALLLNTVANATTDTDKFLVSDSGTIKYRTGAELLADIGTTALASYFISDYDTNIIGSRNSTNKVFTLSTNFVAGTTRVFINGIRLTPGASYDYTETGTNQITFTNAPDSGDLITVDYIKL